jgi:uncharacterized protein (TIGR02444 family)
VRDLNLDNPAWRFAIQLYEKPGVAAELLAQQDKFGLNISLLLFCLWLKVERRSRLTEAQLQEMRSIALPWTSMVVRCLRATRRYLKTAPSVKWPAVAAFRAALQQTEIQSERLQIALLFEWADTRAELLAANDDEPSAACDLDRLLEACGGNGQTSYLDHLRSALALPLPTPELSAKGTDGGPDGGA